MLLLKVAAPAQAYDSKDVLQKFSLKKDDGEHEITDNNNTTTDTTDDNLYRIHLDNSA